MMSNTRYFIVSVTSFIVTAGLMVGSTIIVEDRKVSGGFWGARFAENDRVSLWAATVTAFAVVGLLFAAIHVAFAVGTLVENRRKR